MIQDSVIVRVFPSLQDYPHIWMAMKEFTQNRTEDTVDEIWCLQHPPIFTQGQNGRPEHILNSGSIPVLRIDRGGQVTYHGPGQLVIYPLIDLRRKKLNIRAFVTLLENSVINYLETLGISGSTIPSAPGVYVENKKICSIGLRVKRGSSYHGIALNVRMDLEPFKRINPCGYKNLAVTQLSHYLQDVELENVSSQLINYLAINLGYNRLLQKQDLK